MTMRSKQNAGVTNVHVVAVSVWMMTTSLAGIACSCVFPLGEVGTTSSRTCHWRRVEDNGNGDGHYWVNMDACGGVGDGQLKGSQIIADEGKLGGFRYACLQAHSDDWYLAKVDNYDETAQGNYEYACLKFSPINEDVIVQKRKIIRGFPIKDWSDLDCVESTALVDTALLVTSRALDDTYPCPLEGGFQVSPILGKADPRNGIDLERYKKQMLDYRPKLQFQCAGGTVGRSVIQVDIPEPGETRHGGWSPTRLRCLSSWNRTSSSLVTDEPVFFTSVLTLQVDGPLTFWLFHFDDLQPVGVNSLAGDFVLEKFTGQEIRAVFQGSTGAAGPVYAGQMVRFVSQGHKLCKECAREKSCSSKSNHSCWSDVDSHDCHNCFFCKCHEAMPGRVNKRHSDSFPTKLIGKWDTFSFEPEKRLTVSARSVSTDEFGTFLSWSHREDKPPRRGHYSLVQPEEHGSCFPTYACARMTLLAPGLLSFQLRPAARSLLTAEVLPCQQPKVQDFDFPPSLEKPKEDSHRADVTTLVDPGALQAGPCHLQASRLYPSRGLGSGCLVQIHECVGSCTTFRISLDPHTCGNTSVYEPKLLTQHTCLASFKIRSNRVFLTSSALEGTSGRFLCWVMLSARLFVMPPHKCNPGQVEQELKHARAKLRFDPVQALYMGAGAGGGGGDGGETIPPATDSGRANVVSCSCVMAVILCWTSFHVLKLAAIMQSNPI